MASFLVEVHNNDNTLKLKDVNVTVNWLDFFGNQKKVEAITDINGQAKFSINVLHTTLQITASKSGSIDKDTVDVDFFGFAHPDKIVLNLAFKPLEKMSDTTERLGNEISANIKTIVIVGAIVGSVVTVLYVLNMAKKGETPKFVEQIKSSAPNLKEKFKKANKDLKEGFKQGKNKVY